MTPYEEPKHPLLDRNSTSARYTLGGIDLGKGKRGRPRHSEDVKREPVSFRTTPKLRDRIVAAAEASGRSVTQELELRLERSFRDDDVVAAVLSRLRPTEL